MRIGFSTFLLDGGQTGVATYIRELLRALQLEDVENAYDLLMTRAQTEALAISNPNFSMAPVSSAFGGPLANILWHNTGLAGIGGNYNVVHIPSARRIPFVKRTKVVATVHDLAAFSVHAKYDPARMLFNRKVVPSMIRRADHVIAVSECTKNDLVRYADYPPERISVIYSGINHELFKPVELGEAREKLQLAHGLEKPFFVYVSRLEHPGKNHVRLIEAFERFKMENDSAHQLVFAGAEWHGADAIKRRADESPVREDIVFPGYVPPRSLPLLYSACDAMVFPSLFEGFGFPVIEALACGAPVVCSNAGALKEVVGHVVPMFDPTDAEGMCRRMEAAVAAGRRPEQQARGMDFAARFQWRDTARRVMEVYRSLA